MKDPGLSRTADRRKPPQELMAKFALNVAGTVGTGLERDKIQSEYDDAVALIADLAEAKPEPCGYHHEELEASQTQVWRDARRIEADDRSSPLS